MEIQPDDKDSSDKEQISFFYPEHAIWFYLVYLYSEKSDEDKSIQNKMPGKVLQAREPEE